MQISGILLHITLGQTFGQFGTVWPQGLASPPLEETPKFCPPMVTPPGTTNLFPPAWHFRQLALNAMTLQRLSAFLQQQQFAAAVLNNGARSPQPLSPSGSTSGHSSRVPSALADTSPGQTPAFGLSPSELFTCIKCNKIFTTPHGLEVRS